ncbi:hypothetical protein KR222_007218, partial [Zaprionus bogoriensis]
VMAVVRVLLLCLLYCCLYTVAFRFKMTNVGCESFNQSWVVYRECRLRAISRNKTTLNLLVFVTEPAYNIFMRLQVLKKANGYKPWVMDYMIDCCRFMRKQYHPVAKLIWNLFKDVSTVNHTCPYVGLNGLKDFHSIEHIPLILPSGDYLLNLTWIFDKKPQFVTSVYFTFTEDT